MKFKYFNIKEFTVYLFYVYIQSLISKNEEFCQMKSHTEPQFTWVPVAIEKRLARDRKTDHSFGFTWVLQKANSNIRFDVDLYKDRQLLSAVRWWYTE